MKTKLHLIIMSLVLLFVAGGQSVCLAAESWSYPTTKPETPFGGGDGSWYDPYRIETAQHLANLAYMVTDKNTTYKKKYFILTNDITLNDDVLNDKGTGLKNDESSYKLWTPIGEYGRLYDDDFMGIFDGKGHTIRGMVCINPDGKRRYNGFFGTTDDATIMNLNLEDCYLASNDVKGIMQNYGTLIGVTRNTTLKNCHVSKSVVKVNYNYDGYTDDIFCCVGGMIGQLDNPGNNNFSSFKTNMTNCSFKGNIYVNVPQTGHALSTRVGGLFAHQYKDPAFFAYQYIYLANCSAEGDIYVNSTDDTSAIIVGGIAATLGIGGNEIKNCVNCMNITVDGEWSSCLISGFGDLWEADKKYKVSQCVSLGTIKVGSENKKAKINSLSIDGLFSRNRSILSNCAFYGKYDIHSQGSSAEITSLCDDLYLVDPEKPSVVCSVGNVFDLDYKNAPELDQVSIKTKFIDKDEKVQAAKHKVYYHFEYTGDVTFPCNGTADASKYNKSLAEMKTDDFIKTLNTDAGSNVWGIMTGMNDESLNGLPMPVACGGMVTEYSGTGTLSDPYIINTEYDLDRLKQSVSNGSSFEGIYFKLGSDIYGGNLTSIGESSDKPFKGYFDGNGHAIIGLRKSLFGYMYGKVKNLALVDCDIWQGNYATALARQVGDTDNKAEVSNCYVSGTIAFSTPWNQLGYASTFAFQIAAGSSVHDCYFKGRFVVKEQTFSTYNVAGIAIYDNNRAVNTSAESPEGIFNCYASFDVKVEASEMVSRNTYGITNGFNNESNGIYFVCSDYRVSDNNNGGKKLVSESELNSMFNGKTGWLQGVYRPLLVSAKHYKAKSPEGADAYFDAIPEANPKKNYFYNISIDDPYSDVSLWQLPNMAVYVPNEKKDYITNGYLDQSADFQYKRSADATATAGQLRYDLTQTDKGYHMICLPGVVERNDLPDGAKVMIIGKIQTVGAQEQVNVVMVDTIPAGVPCMLYVPTTTVTTGTTIPLVMRSGIVSTPTVNATYSDFKGSFSKNTNVPVGACTTAIYSGDNNTLPCFVRNTETTTAEPFTAWLEGATGNVQIVDYILLDEENEAMTVTLCEYNAKTYNIKMRRALKKDNWNTICLPYSLTSDEISPLFGSGTKVETFSDLEYNSETNSYTMKFSAATEITAGTPYLIKPSKDVSDNIYEIKDRTITCTSETYVPTGTSQTANNTTLTMQGEYNKRMITPFDVTESENIYVISGDKIYHVNSDVEMKGFHCYFVAKESTTGPSVGGSDAFSNAKVIHSDGTSTDLRLIDAEATGDTDAVYDLLGRKRDAQTKGLVIKNGIKVLKN